MEFKINSKAYWKIALHAFKYPHGQVCGILLGSKKGSAVNITEAIPLFHGAFILAPMLEVALLQVLAGF